MNYFVYIEDILGVCINNEEFSWVYGRVAPKVKKEKFDDCKIKISIEVRKTKDVFDRSFDISKLNKYNYFYANIGKKKIYYERNFLFKARLRYQIEVIGNNINVVINNNYFKFIKYKFMNLHSLDYILTDIVSGILLLNDYATLHCSSIKIGEKTIVTFGPPSSGKTITAIQLAQNNKAEFISEDIALTDGTNIYSIPWTSSFRFYNHNRESKLDRLIGKVQKIIPLANLISLKKKNP